MSADLETARRVKAQLREQFRDDARLRGIGLAADEHAPGSYAVVVRVVAATFLAALELPGSVDGVEVRVAVGAEVVALPESAG